ncbi:hypothetical protein FSP39_023083 [Pinctada imbricata]|uniref:C3H1-type domain-containing protein n=1 Tax=Pinctada imbricata TaxID=66713 RepID=A0AA88YR72_PINIB|nr:hypothetical protein FSP39_023083 [Pinctada imbricata]
MPGTSTSATTSNANQMTGTMSAPSGTTQTVPPSPIGIMNQQATANKPADSHQAEASCSNESHSNVNSILDAVFSAGESVRSFSDACLSTISLTESVPLGATTSAKIKNKIWSNEFVDLKSLLPDQKDEPLSITIKAGKIDVEQSSKNKAPLNINQWTDAFLIFSSIYLEKNPQDACHLLKYCFSVREMSRMHIDPAWRGYDESFRRLRESNTLAWQQPVQELRLKAAAMGSKPPAKTYSQSYKQPFRQISGKVCFAYNRGVQCTSYPCKYAHVCQECSGRHPKSRCFQKNKQKQGRANNSHKQPTNPNKPISLEK